MDTYLAWLERNDTAPVAVVLTSTLAWFAAAAALCSALTVAFSLT